MIETQEFAASIGNLPEVDSNYTVEVLKADLWEHLNKNISTYEQQMSKLKNTEAS